MFNPEKVDCVHNAYLHRESLRRAHLRKVLAARPWHEGYDFVDGKYQKVGTYTEASLPESKGIRGILQKILAQFK